MLIYILSVEQATALMEKGIVGGIAQLGARHKRVPTPVGDNQN